MMCIDKAKETHEYGVLRQKRPHFRQKRPMQSGLLATHLRPIYKAKEIMHGLVYLPV